jgi:sulfite reductase (NADPH) flavoprotein alpha-component
LRFNTAAYVQHHMLAAADELYGWLQVGAYVYVCGDAERMARDVDATLHKIVATAGRMDAKAAHSYVNGLITSHRYVRDVY